jgi:hypothetical protein
MGTFPTGSLANRKQGGPLGLLLTVSLCISGISCLFPPSAVVFLNYYYFSNYLLRFDDTYINIHSYNIHSSRQSDITFIHERFLIITEVGKVFIHRKNVTRYSDIADMVLHVVIIRRVSILFKVAFYTVMIRYAMQVSVALSAEHLPPGCGEFTNWG